jgi:hypothetical protein
MKFISVVLILILFSCAIQTPEEQVNQVLSNLNVESIKANLTYIASDEMKGRLTGSPELKKTAKYITEKLKAWGYSGAAENGSYLQTFNMIEGVYDNSTLTAKYKSSLKVEAGKNIVVYNRSKIDVNINEKPFFIKEGIYSANLKQFDRSSVKGKTVLRYSLTDAQKAANSKLSDRTVNAYLTDSLGVKNIIVILNNSDADDRMFKMWNRRGSGSSLRFTNKPGKPTIVYLKETLAKKLYRADRVRSYKKGKVGVLKNSFVLSVKANSKQITTQNIIATLPGTDVNLKDEYVAYGAHYDHHGVTAEGLVLNGADDDGSGTVAVMEMASAIAKNPPKRSTMIAFHTGEEKGLLGSAYYAENQLIPMKNIVALFNMDMVGRSGKKVKDDSGKDVMADYSGKLVDKNDNTRITMPNEIYVIGADKLSQELHNISEKANKTHVNLDLNYDLNDESHPARIYYRSDHWNYAKHGVPIIFYFDGIHEDYHKATDTIEKIDFNKIYQTSKLALATGYIVANMDRRIVVDKK